MRKGDDAHWTLLGEAVVAFMKRPHKYHRVFNLPHGLHRIPGPVLVLAQQFIDSPVGPYLSLSIAEPVRLGLRPGYFFGLSVLNSAEARRAGRQYWGFPHELGRIHWLSEAGERRIEWEERGLKLTASIQKKPMPLFVPIRTLQGRSDGPVIVPTHLRALARRAKVDVEFADNDELHPFTGVHTGLALSGMIVRRKAARQPLGLLSTLRAPLRAPEPGVAGMGRLPKRDQPHSLRHYS